MSELLGITGAIGSGKTTFAHCLANTVSGHAHYEVYQLIAEIAGAFNEALKAELAFETTSNDLELTNQVLIWLPDAVSEHLHHDIVWNQLAIVKHDVLAHPELYQKLFEYLAIIRKNPMLLNVAITTETKKQFRPLLQWLGGYLIAKISKTIWFDELLRRIEQRDPTTSLVVITGLRYPSDAAVVRAHRGKIIAIERSGSNTSNSDVTEASRVLIEPDTTINNNGTLKQLQMLAETVWDDLQAGKLVKYYDAKTV